MPGGSRAIASARPGTTASRRHRDTNWAYEAADEAQEERTLAVAALEQELVAHEHTRRKLQAAAQGSSELDRAVFEANEAHGRLAAVQIERQREVAALCSLLDAARAAERRARLAAADASARQQHESDAAAAAMADAERGREYALVIARHRAVELDWARRRADVDVTTLAVEIRARECTPAAQAASTRTSPAAAIPSAGLSAGVADPGAAVRAAGLFSAAPAGSELTAAGDSSEGEAALHELFLDLGGLQGQISSLAAAAAAADSGATALEFELASRSHVEARLAAAEAAAAAAVASRAEASREAAAAEERAGELSRRNGALEARLAVVEAAAAAAAAAGAEAGAAAGAAERRALTRCILVALQEEESARLYVARSAATVAAEALGRESGLRAELDCARDKAAALVAEVEALQGERAAMGRREEEAAEARRREQVRVYVGRSAGG